MRHRCDATYQAVHAEVEQHQHWSGFRSLPGSEGKTAHPDVTKSNRLRLRGSDHMRHRPPNRLSETAAERRRATLSRQARHQPSEQPWRCRGGEAWRRSRREYGASPRPSESSEIPTVS